MIQKGLQVKVRFEVSTETGCIVFCESILILPENCADLRQTMAAYNDFLKALGPLRDLAGEEKT